MTFAERVKYLRDIRKMTEAQLAELAGLSYGSIRNYVSGRRVPPFPAVVKLSRALGCSTEEFAACEFPHEPRSADNPLPRSRGRTRKP